MTHLGIDGRLWCGDEKATAHKWERGCCTGRDPNAHPYLCCKHAQEATRPDPIVLPGNDCE